VYFPSSSQGEDYKTFLTFSHFWTDVKSILETYTEHEKWIFPSLK